MRMSKENNSSEWKRSSFGEDNDTYVRVKTAKGFVYVSTKDSAVTVMVPTTAWEHFVQGVKKGDFD